MVAVLVSDGGKNCGNGAGDAPYPATGFDSSSLHLTGQNQEPSFDGLNRHGKLRYSWAVDLKAAG